MSSSSAPASIAPFVLSTPSSPSPLFVDYVRFHSLRSPAHVGAAVQSVVRGNIEGENITLKNSEVAEAVADVSAVPLIPYIDPPSSSSSLVPPSLAAYYRLVASQGPAAFGVSAHGYEGIVKGSSNANYWRYYWLETALCSDSSDSVAAFYCSRVLVAHKAHNELAKVEIQPATKGYPFYWDEKANEYYFTNRIHGLPHLLIFHREEPIEYPRQIFNIQFFEHNNNNNDEAQEEKDKAPATFCALYGFSCPHSGPAHSLQLCFLFQLAIAAAQSRNDYCLDGRPISALIDATWRTIIPQLIKRYHFAHRPPLEDEASEEAADAVFFAFTRCLAENRPNLAQRLLHSGTHKMGLEEFVERLQELLPAKEETEEWFNQQYMNK